MTQTTRRVSAALAILLASQPVIAQQHLVTESDIEARLQAAAAERAAQRLAIDGFLSDPLAAQVASSLGVDLREARAAVASLSDDELRDLATRAASLQTDPAPGGKKALVIVGVIVVVIVLLAILVVAACKEQGAECLNKK